MDDPAADCGGVTGLPFALGARQAIGNPAVTIG
jgi:hypothetical protein